MWFVTIIVLALAAFFTMKVLKSQDLRKAAEKEREMQRSGLEGTLSGNDSTLDAPSSTGTPASDSNTARVSAEASSSTSSTAAGAAGAALSASALLNSGDTMNDIREMIKILNLAEPDAGRLAISREEFNAIRLGGDAAEPSGESLTAVAQRLRKMIA